MGKPSVKSLKKRRDAAQREKDEIQPLLDDIYRYILPFRKSTKDSGRGEQRVDQVFDSTAIDSAFRFAGKVQQDLWPAGQENFQLDPGPIVIDPVQRDQLARQLEPVTAVTQAFFEDGEWDMAFHEMAIDLVAGTGAILMNSTSDPSKLWEPISVPTDQLLLESGQNNSVSGIFWERKMALRVLFDTWPDGKFSQTLKDELKQNSEKEVEVCCDTVHLRSKNRWLMAVYVKGRDDDDYVFEQESRTCPWLTPRYFRLAGETWGRGVGHLALPEVKTTNTSKRLTLQAAAIAMLGIYTAVDDGVFNPDLSPIEPGVFWKVSRNGGTLGPSVNRFPDPRIDLSNLVLKEMQMQVKATMMDQALPPEAAAVRSATEILERVKRLASDHIGAYGRMVKEVVVPAVKRVIELAYNKQLIGNEIEIDQLLYRVRVKSPIAMSREAQRIERVIQWLELVLMIGSQMAQMGDATIVRDVAKVKTQLAEIGKAMGIPMDHIVSLEERQANEQRDQKAAEMQAAAQAAMVAAASGAAPAADGGVMA